MMTLKDFAQFICKKMSKEDAASLAMCKQFLQNRYGMIYDTAPWSEALATVAVPVRDGEVVLPAMIDRVVRVLPREGAHLQEAIEVVPLSDVATERHPDHEPLLMWSEDDGDRHAVRVRGVCDGNEVDELLRLNGRTEVKTAHAYDTVEGLSREQGQGRLCVDGAETKRRLVVLGAQESHRRHTRLRLPEYRGDTCVVTGKRRLVPMRHDLDTPMLNGVSNALLAFAEADMLEHARAFEKAQIKITEGMAHLKTMREIDNNQAAPFKQIVPLSSSYEPLW